MNSQALQSKACMISTAPEIAISHVLLATADPLLRETRAALITNFGFHTTTCSSLDEAICFIQDMRFDILVLGHTLSVEACRTISAKFRELQPSARSSRYFARQQMTPRIVLM
jgi:CheY-like chemotaxis protein